MKTAVLIMSLIFVSISAWSKVTFPRQTIKVGNISVNAEIASTDAQHEQGLMFRQTLKEGRGMLFVFNEAQLRTFWMKNTFIPLSIGFFDSNKKLIDIQEMEPAKSEIDANIKTYTSSAPAQYVLEAPKGWFVRHKINKGEVLKLQK